MTFHAYMAPKSTPCAPLFAQNIVAKQQLVNSINNILSGTSISNSQVNWETPKNSSKTTTTGMYGDNSNSMMGYGDKATKNHSRLIQKKDV